MSLKRNFDKLFVRGLLSSSLEQRQHSRSQHADEGQTKATCCPFMDVHCQKSCWEQCKYSGVAHALVPVRGGHSFPETAVVNIFKCLPSINNAPGSPDN